MVQIMDEEIKLELGKPCPSCGNTDLKECKICKKLICLNCFSFAELPRSKGYLCENCFMEQRKKMVRGS